MTNKLQAPKVNDPNRAHMRCFFIGICDLEFICVLGFVICNFLFFAFFLATTSFAQVNLTVSAKNPSEFSEREVEAKAYLPKEVTPQNVLDQGDLELGFDVKRGQYFVYKKIVLKELESVSYNVQIEDIWLIDPKRIEILKEHVKNIMVKLKNTEYEKPALMLQQDIDEGLNEIADTQRQNDVSTVSVAQHIGVYTKNLKILKNVRELIGILEKLLLSVGKEVKDPMGISGASVKMIKFKRADDYAQAQNDSCIEEEKSKDTEGKGIFSENNTLYFSFDVENPSDKKTSFPVKYYMPKEIMAEDILESGILKRSYDFSEEKYYVYNDSIAFEPRQKITFEVTVKDRWMVDKQELLATKLHLEKILIIMRKLEGYENEISLGEKALRNIYSLLNKTPGDELTKEYVIEYYADQGLFDETKRDILKIEDRLYKDGVKIDATIIVDDEILCEEMQASKENKTIAEKFVKKKKTLDMLKDILLQGKSPDAVTVWRIIVMIIAVLGIMSLIFFLIWSGQTNKEKRYQKMNPTIEEDKDANDRES